MLYNIYMKRKIDKLFRDLGKLFVLIATSKIVLFIFIELLLLLLCQSFKFTYWIAPIYIIQFPITLAVLLFIAKEK